MTGPVNSRMKLLIHTLVFFLTLDAHALINGAPLKNAPDVVRIKFSNGWVCSGVYLDPYTILTSAHCISLKKEKLQIDHIESENDVRLDVKMVHLIPNPSYSSQFWPAYDIGIIKTTINHKFTSSFQLQKSHAGYFRDAILFGCGRVDYNKKVYFRTTGENNYLQIGSVIFFTGNNSNIKDSTGIKVSIAPNDSGGPILDKKTKKIIGVMTATMLKESINYGIPALSIGTSTVTEHNLSFIRDHMGLLNRE